MAAMKGVRGAAKVTNVPAAGGTASWKGLNGGRPGQGGATGLSCDWGVTQVQGEGAGETVGPPCPAFPAYRMCRTLFGFVPGGLEA